MKFENLSCEATLNISGRLLRVKLTLKEADNGLPFVEVSSPESLEAILTFLTILRKENKISELREQIKELKTEFIRRYYQ